VAKHAQASVAYIDVDVHENALRLRVRDDGLGGADPARGSGLIGPDDRVEALGGTMHIDSPPARDVAARHPSARECLRSVTTRRAWHSRLSG